MRDRIAGRFGRAVLALAALPLLLPLPAAHAQLVNGGFESDFTGWTLLPAPAPIPGIIMTNQAGGNWFGEDPPQGTKMAFIDSDTTRGARSTASLESFLGLSSGTLSGLGEGTVVNGAAFYQDVNTANPVATLTFTWDFLTAEDPGFNPQNDFAFLVLRGPSIAGSGVTVLSRFADAATPTPFPAPPGVTSPNRSDDYLSETLFQNSSSFTLPSSGTYRIGFGVVNVGNGSIASALLVDNVVLQSGGAVTAPEPGSLRLGLTLLGLVGGLAMERRRRSARSR